jgi:hypothetical protein
MSWKSGSLKFLEPSGPHRACYGTALPLPLPLPLPLHDKDLSFVGCGALSLGNLRRFGLSLQGKQLLLFERLTHDDEGTANTWQRQTPLIQRPNITSTQTALTASNLAHKQSNFSTCIRLQ